VHKIPSTPNHEKTVENSKQEHEQAALEVNAFEIKDNGENSQEKDPIDQTPMAKIKEIF